VPKPRGRKRRNSTVNTAKDDKIYFEGKVVETYPGTVFGVEVSRKNGLAPMFVKAGLKAVLIKKRVMIIKGDAVTVEINPEDMSSNDTTLKGIIVQRVNINLNMPAPTNK
jgi:translation initiation factor IF-1